ncbi:MAG: serine/threonine protein kinase, partial [Planctomycetia bacterium]
MPTPSPEQFWKLLAASRLVADDVLASLRRDFSRESPSGGKDGGDADTTGLAKWLVHRGVITKWQGRRLLSGDSGPFFLGDYRLLDRLEAEGAGRLFRGRHEPSGRRVCVMLLDRKLCQRVDVWTEVVRRSGIAINATAPILSRTWALEEKQGSRFLVCEDVEGASLTDELGRTGPLEPAKALALMLPVVSAVAELHRRGSVHGSLSLDALRREPAADGAGRVRLLQIPLAGDPHAVPAQPPLDATERIAGLGRRASFIAPELMLPGRFADERSDVYALGCMLHALLTGVLPCWQGDAQRTLSQAAFVGPPRLGPPQVPDEVAALVAYMVQRDPKDRYQDAAEAADQLAACLKQPPVSPGLPPPSRQAARPAGAARESDRSPSQPTVTGAPTAGIAVAAGRPQAGRSRTARMQLVGLGVAGGLALVAGVLAWSRGSGQRPT